MIKRLPWKSPAVCGQNMLWYKYKSDNASAIRERRRYKPEPPQFICRFVAKYIINRNRRKICKTHMPVTNYSKFRCRIYCDMLNNMNFTAKSLYPQYWADMTANSQKRNVHLKFRINYMPLWLWYTKRYEFDDVVGKFAKSGRCT